MYAGGGDARDLEGVLTTAFRLGRDVEAGVRAGLLERRREAGAILFGSPLPDTVNGTGLADPQIYGKYRVVRSPIELAVGAAAWIPLAQEESGRGPGVWQYEAFVGLRRGFSRAALVGSLGATARGAARSPGRAEGRTSALAGLGLLAPLGQDWMLVGELTYEGPRFGNDRSERCALAGLDWRPTGNLALRGTIGAGLTAGSPDRLAILSLAFHL